MWKRALAHVRANAIAYLALGVALGVAPAYAGHLTVRSSDIVDGEVRTADLRNGAVTTQKLRRGAVTAAKLRPRAVTAAAIRNRGIGPAKLARSFPSARVSNAAGQTAPNALRTVLGFDQVLWDTAGLHSPANPTRLTAPVGGVYVVTASVEWLTLGGAGGFRILRIRKGGPTGPVQVVAGEKVPTTPETTAQQALTTQLRLEPDEYVEVEVYQQDGGPRNVAGSATTLNGHSPELSMTWVAPD